MNVFDIGLILMCIMFFIVGFKRGAIKEAVSFIGIVLVFLISYHLKEVVGSFLCTFFPFIEFSGALEGLTTINIFLYQAIAFIIVFSLLLSIYSLLIKISGVLQKILDLTIIFLIPSKIIGAFISLLKGWIVLFAILIVLMVPFKNFSLISESKMVQTILYKTPILSSSASSFVDALSDVYDLSVKVGKKQMTVNDANLKALNIMLKYKVVKKTTVEKLIEKNKLDEVQNIESVLQNY